MATEPTTSPLPAAAPQRSNEIKVVSHSGLFYWWPVWAIGYLMALVTFASGEWATTFPGDTKDIKQLATPPAGAPLKLESKDGKSTIELKGDESVIVVPPGANGKTRWTDRWLHMSSSKSLGVIWCTVILLVVFITNIPLRGLWSVIVIVIIISTVTILATLGLWDNIVNTLGLLDIRINLGGYIFISSILLGIWVVVMSFFDQQVYMIFTPGQFRVRQEIGDAEEAHDATGMTMQKQRSDLFRHWILGLGSGDLIVRTSGAHPKEFHMNNVLFLGRKVKLIEEMLRSKPIVAGPMK